MKGLQTALLVFRFLTTLEKKRLYLCGRLLHLKGANRSEDLALAFLGIAGSPYYDRVVHLLQLIKLVFRNDPNIH